MVGGPAFGEPVEERQDRQGRAEDTDGEWWKPGPVRTWEMVVQKALKAPNIAAW
ncbi:hypothetical protein [Streptomyces hygroscopicus]|uniref:hypothetical protein n=1 Tax=Streptomyces hygroscopicus TaxID=1912 RepID=UPI00223EB5FC|nr:hypothetical protein [Streptomyces hygroscopicus]